MSLHQNCGRTNFQPVLTLSTFAPTPIDASSRAGRAHSVGRGSSRAATTATRPASRGARPCLGSRGAMAFVILTASRPRDDKSGLSTLPVSPSYGLHSPSARGKKPFAFIPRKVPSLRCDKAARSRAPAAIPPYFEVGAQQACGHCSDQDTRREPIINQRVSHIAKLWLSRKGSSARVAREPDVG